MYQKNIQQKIQFNILDHHIICFKINKNSKYKSNFQNAQFILKK